MSHDADCSGCFDCRPSRRRASRGCELCRGYNVSYCPACGDPDHECSECGSSTLWDHRDGSDEQPPLCVDCAREAGECCTACESIVEDKGDKLCVDCTWLAAPCPDGCDKTNGTCECPARELPAQATEIAS